MENSFDNADDFISKFDLSDPLLYEDVVHLKDTKIGFSIKREYPSNIRYQPPRTQSGIPDQVVLIRIAYLDSNESTEAGPLVPLDIKVNSHSKYFSSHFDHNEDDPDCPTKESITQSKRTAKPSGLEFIGNYYYDRSKDVFCDNKGNNFTGRELLDEVFNYHCNTVHLIKGLELQIKLRTRSILITLINLFTLFIPTLLKYVFARKMESDKNINSFTQGYKFEEFKKSNEETINISGYKAPLGVVILLSILIITIYSLLYFIGIDSGYFYQVFVKNKILAPFCFIILLWILDYLVPFLLFFFNNALIKYRIYLMLKKFNYP